MVNSACRRLALGVLSFGLTLVVGGCGSTAPSRLYLLHAVPSSPAAEAGGSGDLTLGIGPVVIPGYLDRPQIVTRTSGHEIRTAEFDRWGEPLKESLTRVLAGNLSRMVGTDRIAFFPWRGDGLIDYRVTMDVTRFDGALGGDATLEARWVLTAEKSDSVLAVRHSILSAPVEAQGGYEGLVAALSQLLADLSRQIAAAIREAPRNATTVPETPG
jgi:uncharacterized lipoprotein YmbA